MCGIAGQFNRDPARGVDGALIRRMCDTIVHRGPDDEGQFVRGSVGLGVRRLRIIDLEQGHQPMTTQDGRVTIAFNGEIYNYRELRHGLESRGHRFATASDTECILHAYVENGVDCLAGLNGIFAIAIWDETRQRLFLARDRIGVKPLYVYDDGESIAFASELKTLLSVASVPRELDHDAFAYYLRYGYVGAPATLLRHIRKLPPAHYMTAGRDDTSTHRYWNLSYATENLSEDEYAARVYDTLRRSMTRQLVSDVPVGAFLSGGLDSSSIVQLMTEITGRPVNTYSIGFEGDDSFHNELPDAARIAARYKTHHHEILVQPDVARRVPDLVRQLDQPLSDSSFVVTYLLSRLARESVTVALSGVGGDEIFGGYRRYLGPRIARYYKSVPSHARRAASSAFSRLKVDRGSALRNYMRLARAFVTSHQMPAFEQYDRFVQLTSDAQLAGLGQRPARGAELIAERRMFFDQPTDGDSVTRMMHLDLNTSLPESLLMLTDSMSMASSVEVRVPFLDHELVELVASIPSSLKIKGLRLRHIQKRSMEGHLPRHVFTKRKWGFGCPVGGWFRRELKELLRDTLQSDRLRRQGLLHADAVQRIITDHERCQEDNSDLLLALLTFQLWHSEWLGS
jgi:asparagine synthase (glutamine-hydrolysing)